MVLKRFIRRKSGIKSQQKVEYADKGSIDDLREVHVRQDDVSGDAIRYAMDHAIRTENESYQIRIREATEEKFNFRKLVLLCIVLSIVGFYAYIFIRSIFVPMH